MGNEDMKYGKEAPETTGKGREMKGQLPKQAKPDTEGEETPLHTPRVNKHCDDLNLSQKAEKGVAQFESHEQQGDNP